MLSINISELIWTIINFFLLYFVLKRFLFGPVGKLLDERQAKVDAGVDAQKQAQAAVQANRDRIAEEKEASREEAAHLIAAAESEGEQLRADALREAKSRAKDALREGKAQLDVTNTQEEALLAEKSGELTALLTARILDSEE